MRVIIETAPVSDQVITPPCRDQWKSLSRPPDRSSRLLRLTKADIAGAGTSALLLAACALVFLVAGGLVIFSDWTGPGGSDGPADLTARKPGPLIAADAFRGAGRSGRSRPPRVPGRSTPSGRPRTRAQASAGVVAPVGPVRGRTPADPRAPRPGDPSRSPGSSSPPISTRRPASPSPARPQADLRPVIRGVTKGLADTTRGITKGTGQTVSGVGPQLGQTMAGTGDTVSELIDAIGGQ